LLDGKRAVTDDATVSSSSPISIITVEAAAVSCTLDSFFTKVAQRDVGSWMSIVVVEFNCGVKVFIVALVVPMSS